MPPLLEPTDLPADLLLVSHARFDHLDIDSIDQLVSMDGKRLYTACREVCLHGVDLFIPPINGAFGNMNEQEAARAAALVAPTMTVPCHFWNFAEHGGNPLTYKEAMEAAGLPYTLMTVGGEPYIL